MKECRIVMYTESGRKMVIPWRKSDEILPMQHLTARQKLELLNESLTKQGFQTEIQERETV